MMRSLILLLCIAFVVEAKSEKKCQRKWSYFPKAKKCFRVFGGKNDPVQPTTWEKAEEYCNKRFIKGHLASLHSDDEVNFVVDLAHKADWDDGGGSRLHIGLTYIGNTDWEWTDGSDFNYVKWWIDGNIANDGFASANPRGLLHTKRVYMSTFWAGNNIDQKAFLCQMPRLPKGLLS